MTEHDMWREILPAHTFVPTAEPDLADYVADQLAERPVGDPKPLNFH
ncbi:MAG: hypothetical protein J7D61_07920 [Marichromatium sp.]|nr:hypothetical protein [Marichromatium sp.]